MTTRAWDGTLLPAWPSGWRALNPFAWAATAYERADLLTAPPGFSEQDRERIVAAGGIGAIHHRRRLDAPTLRERHDDEIRVAQLLGYGTQRLRVLALAQRMECEQQAYHIEAMRNEAQIDYRFTPIDFRRDRR